MRYSALRTYLPPYQERTEAFVVQQQHCNNNTSGHCVLCSVWMEEYSEGWEAYLFVKLPPLAHCSGATVLRRGSGDCGAGLRIMMGVRWG